MNNMTNKEKLQKTLDNIGYEAINATEITENTFVARFNNHACTETKVYYGFEEDGLNINFFGDIVPVDPALLLELIFEKSLNCPAAENEHNGMKLSEMVIYAPDELINLFHDKAKEMGLVPKPSGYLDNGDPVYSLEDIAKTHGISMDEAEKIAGEMGIEPYLVDANKINRIN